VEQHFLAWRHSWVAKLESRGDNVSKNENKKDNLYKKSSLKTPAPMSHGNGAQKQNDNFFELPCTASDCGDGGAESIMCTHSIRCKNMALSHPVQNDKGYCGKNNSPISCFYNLK